MKENAINSLLHKISVFKDLYKYQRKKLLQTVTFAVSRFFLLSRTFTSAKNLKIFPFFQESLLHVDILEIRVVEQSLEVYFKIPPDRVLIESIFSTESGFPFEWMSVKFLNIGHLRKFPLLQYF